MSDAMLECEKHGTMKWQGHVACGACGRVFQTIGSRFPRFAPETCPCGVALRPSNPKFPEEGKEYSACAICFQCFRNVVKKFGGQLPPPSQANA